MYREVKTLEYFPEPERIVFREFADLLSANNRLVTKFHKGWTKPNPKQVALRDTYWEYSGLDDDPVQTFLLYGSTRSGKTVGTIALIIELLLTYPGTRALGVRRTYTELWDSLIPSVEEFLERCGFEPKKDFTIRREPPGIYFANGSCWIFRSAEKADKAKEGKADNLGGMEFAVAMMEEANELKIGYYNTLVTRLSQQTLPARAIFIVENPPDNKHWTWTKFAVDSNTIQCDVDGNVPKEFKANSNYHAFHFPVEDNEENLPKGYIKSLEEEFAQFPHLLNKFRYGLFSPTVVGHPIFQHIFNRNLHVNEGPIKFDKRWPIIRTWDFGFRRPAVVLCQDNPETGQITWLRATLGHNELLESFAKRQIHIHKQMYQNAKFRDICDQSGKRRSDLSVKNHVDVLKGLGLSPEYKFTLIEYGINLMQDLLATILPGGEPAMKFDPLWASELIDAFHFGYTQDEEHKTDEIKPVKDMYYEHVMDCARYATVMIRELTSSKTRRPSVNRMYRTLKPGQYVEEVRKVSGYGSRKGPRYGFGKRSW